MFEEEFMKKKFFAVVFFVFAFILPAFSADKTNTTLVECNNRMKNIVQALEIWANDHKNLFPSKEEYASSDFDKYFKKIGASSLIRICPASKEKFIYEPQQGGKSFIVRVPFSESYGLSSYYYSRDKGFVKGTEVAVKKYEPQPPADEKTDKQKDDKKTEAAKSEAKKPETKPTAAPQKTEAAKSEAKKPEAKPTAAAQKTEAAKSEAKKPETKPTAAAQKTEAAKSEAKKPPVKPAEKPPAKEDKANIAKLLETKELTKLDEEKIKNIIKELYDAYAERDVTKVLKLQKRSIESSAIDYEKQGKGSADDVREAFKSATEEIISHRAFKMLPLNLSDLTFQKKGDFCRVTSVVPIIATDRLEIEDNGKYFFVRLRIAEFIFAPEGDNWVIENMYLY